MADESKSAPVMAEDSENTPLMAEYSSNEVSEQSKLDVQQYESSTTESDKGDTGSVAAAVGGDVNIERVESSGDSDDRKELIREAEITEASLGEASRGHPQQPIMLEYLSSNPPRDATDLASAAACESRTAAISCRQIICATRDAITEAKVRVDKALRKAEEVGDLGSMDRCRALANKYNAAIKMADRRVGQVEAAAESADKASTAAETVAREMSQEPNADSNAEQKLSDAYNAATTASTAVIVAYKTEDVALKAMKRCWEDLDYGNVETRGYSTTNPEETRCGGRKLGKITAGIFAVVLFILGICLLASVVLYTENSDHRISLITVGIVLVTIPLCLLFYQIYICRRNKRREAKLMENSNVIAKINHRLGELHSYFKKNSITPEPSDEE